MYTHSYTYDLPDCFSCWIHCQCALLMYRTVLGRLFLISASNEMMCLGTPSPFRLTRSFPCQGQQLTPTSRQCSRHGVDSIEQKAAIPALELRFCFCLLPLFFHSSLTIVGDLNKKINQQTSFLVYTFSSSGPTCVV